MKLTRNFELKEFVPLELIDKIGENAAYWCIDPRLPYLAQLLHDFFVEHFGPDVSMIINTPNLQFRGFRPPYYKNKAEYSQHRFGRAFDFNIKVKGKPLDSDVVFDLIIADRARFNGNISAIEDKESTKGWTHVDIRPLPDGHKHIMIVKP